MRKTRVYIASPYSNGNKEELVQKHLDAAYHLLKLGFNPFAPLYNHFIQSKHPDLDCGFDWLEVDKDWLSLCDLMVRLHFTDENGVEIQSPGADEEERFATELRIPVMHFSTLEDMVLFMSDVDTQIE